MVLNTCKGSLLEDQSSVIVQSIALADSRTSTISDALIGFNVSMPCLRRRPKIDDRLTACDPNKFELTLFNRDLDAVRSRGKSS